MAVSGVFSSCDTLATKSRRTVSSRRRSVKQLPQRRQGFRRTIAQQAASRGVGRCDRAPFVRGDDTIGERLDQRARLLALPPQIVEAALQLVMHRAERVHLVRQLRNVYVGEF